MVLIVIAVQYYVMDVTFYCDTDDVSLTARKIIIPKTSHLRLDYIVYPEIVKLNLR